MAQIIDGKAIAADVRREVAADVAALSSAHGLVSISFPLFSAWEGVLGSGRQARDCVLTQSSLARSQVPGLAVVIVGSRKDSQTYVNMKRKACAEVGICSIDVDLPEDISETALVAEVHRLNADPAVHGTASVSFSFICLRLACSCASGCQASSNPAWYSCYVAIVAISLLA